MKAQAEANAVPTQGAAVYRKAATTPRRSHDLVFNRMPQAVRDRLSRAILHGGAAEPLVAAPFGRAPLGARGLLAIAGIACVGVIGVGAWGFADPSARYPIQPAIFAAIYGALFFVAAIAIAVFVERRRVQHGVPFRPGRYLFALDLVEVTAGRVRVTSLDTLRDVEARPREVALVFHDGHTVAFPTSGDPAAIAARANRAINAARALVYPADEIRLEGIDPFFEIRVTDDWAAAAETGRAARAKLAWLAGAAAIAAAPVGFGIVHGRNAFSDDTMFEEAKTFRPGEARLPKLARYAQGGRRHLDEVRGLLVEAASDDPSALRRYVARGGVLGELADDALFEIAKNDAVELSRYIGHRGRHADQADDALFEIARRLDTTASYGTYLEHGRKHAAEVKTELLPEADFTQAKKSDLVGSLFSYVRRNPGTKHEDEAWRIIRDAYAGALPAFHAADGGNGRFAEALLVDLQGRADPRMDLEVVMGDGRSLAEAEGLLAARYGDRYMSATSRFTPRALDSLSVDIRAAVSNWFGKVFPHGVVEPSRPYSEEVRPHITIRCTPVLAGTSEWHSATDPTAAVTRVTQLVNFIVEVRGTVSDRDGKDTTVAWTVKVQDDVEAKVLTKDIGGRARAESDIAADAFQAFFDVVPQRIAASFHDKL